MKSWSIAWKDTVIRFRDRNGLLLMLAAPLVLAAIIGAAFGGFSGGNGESPITDIPLVVVNADEGELGGRVVAILQSDDLAGLLEPEIMADLDAARDRVEQGEMRAVVYIPPEFTASVTNPGAAANGSRSTIILHTDPGSAFSPLIVRAVVGQIAGSFNAGAVGGQIVTRALIEQGALAQVVGRMPEVLAATAAEAANSAAVSLRVVTAGSGLGASTNPLAYFAPAMAILFLLFSMFDAANSILEEEREGTLARMMSTPTTFAQILTGKIGGVFLTGMIQLGLLILASRLLFGLTWGSEPLGLLLVAVATVAAAASLGVFIVAFARDASQAGFIGAAVALTNAILGGTFVASQAYPDWLQPLSKLTINRWALDAFTALTLRGQGLVDVLPAVAVLSGFTILFFSLALWRLPRRFVR